jgi:CarD family transcriptional regulator
MMNAAFGATGMEAKARDRAPFCKGEFVVYPTHGVGRVDRVGLEDFSGRRLNLIRVSFADNQMTLLIPVARARAAGLRRLASPEALDLVLATLRGHPRVSRVLWAKRAREYTAKINSGDLILLSEVVRDLQRATDGTGGSASKRNLFELAMERLAREFAAVSATSKTEAVIRLTQALQRTRNADADQAEHLTESA